MIELSKYKRHFRIKFPTQRQYLSVGDASTENNTYSSEEKGLPEFFAGSCRLN